MVGLNFPGNAEYKPYADGMDNVAPFEFIPWVLGQCSNVDEAVELISQINILNVNFSGEYPLAPLHWMISDRNNSITVEPVSQGLEIYDNPYGVLTNNPKFDYHSTNLINYMGVTREPPVNKYSDKLKLEPYSLGMGSIGLPGDMSSASRFIRAVFTKMNSVCQDGETESVAQFFHILGAVEQPKGCTSVGGGEYEYTIYSCCCNTDKGVYYYTTYNNRGITAVDMHKEDLNSNRVIMFPLETEPQIFRQN